MLSSPWRMLYTLRTNSVFTLRKYKYKKGPRQCAKLQALSEVAIVVIAYFVGFAQDNLNHALRYFWM